MNTPEQFGKYFILERIAVGGMAEVFKAKVFGVEGFQKTVALKRILPNVAENAEFITMFIDEAKIAVQLTHANIAQIFELGDVYGSYFIAMEYIFGRDLRAIYERARRKHNGCTLSPQQAAYIISRACEGLDYAHRKEDAHGNHLQLIHRDISPQNLLVSYNGEVKIIDFGVAKAQNKMGQTQAGILKGKFAYMSPEQITTGAIDARSDVFSLGILLYELLTLERCFLGTSDFQTLERVREAKIEAPSQLNPHVPKELDDIVFKALTKDPDDRYHTAGEMQEALLRYLYSHTPVYSQRDLALFMKDIFSQEIEQEQARISQYDTYFDQALRSGQIQPVSASSTSSWHRQMQNPSFSVGYVPAHHYEGSRSGYQPPPHSNSWNGGDALPEESLPLDDIIPPELLNDEGNDTVMESKKSKQEEVSTQKIVLFALLTAISISVIVGGIMFYLKVHQRKTAVPRVGKLQLMFEQSTEDVQFFVNDKQITHNKLHTLPENGVELPFPMEGLYALRIEKKGFQPIQRRFSISLGDIQILKGIRWKKALGKVLIQSQPAGATLFINGKRQKHLTPFVYSIMQGPAEIELLKKGHFPQKTKLDIQEEKNPPQDIQLRPAKYAELRLECENKEKVWVYLNGKYKGKTPFEYKKLNPLKSYEVKLVAKNKKGKPLLLSVDFPLRILKKMRVRCPAGS